MIFFEDMICFFYSFFVTVVFNGCVFFKLILELAGMIDKIFSK